MVSTRRITRDWRLYAAAGVALALGAQSALGASPAQKQEHQAAECNSDCAASDNDSSQYPAVVPQAKSAQKPSEAERNRTDDNGDNSEYVEVLGRRLKLTDALLTAFTGLLVMIGAWQGHQLRRTVNAMRDTERRQLRAYVGIEKISFEIKNLRNKKILDPHVMGVAAEDFIVIEMRNFGQSPAFNVSVYAYIPTTDATIRLPASYLEERDTDVADANDIRPSVSRSLIQAGQAQTSKISIFNLTGVRKAHARHATQYVFGRIYYRDAYNRPWRTKFCFVWEPQHPGGERFIPYEHGNGEDQKEAPELIIDDVNWASGTPQEDRPPTLA